MKLLRYTCHASALTLLLLGGFVASCTDDSELLEGTASGLQLSPAVFSLEDGMKTRAVPENITDIVSRLREDYMGQKLDVFVVGNGANNASFFNRYSFTGSATSPIQSIYYLMENDWRFVNTAADGYSGAPTNQQYKVGDQYKLYALVNYDGPEITSLTELKAAKTGDADTDIFRWYQTGAAPGRYDGWSNDKTFTMDGSVEFTFGRDEGDKQLDVHLKRAAAKIVLDLKIDPEFLKNYQEKNDADEVIGLKAGNPRFRPVKFNYHAYAVGDITRTAEEALDPLFVTQSMFNVPRTSAADDYTKLEYQLTTYCYPFDWSDDVTEKSPCLIVSCGFANKFYYYHIPITQNGVKELKRNHVYHIDAEIVGLGALTAEEELEKVVNLHYDVIPWANAESEVSIVDVSSEMEFLLVDPTEDKIFGDGQGTSVINYYAPAGATVRTTEPEVYYYNANGYKITSRSNNTTNSSSPYWTGATVTPGQGSTFNVTSTGLTNKAVKFIKFYVYLDSDGNGVMDANEKRVPVTVKHFTLQNLQNIAGKWSSKARATTETTWDLSVAQSWGDYQYETGTFAFSYDEYIADPTHITRGTEQTSSNRYTNMGLGQWDWGDYDSEANSYFSNVDYYCYWRTGSYLGGYTYHRVQYTRTGTIYYHQGAYSTTYGSTSWADDEFHTGNRNEANVWNDNGDGFTAKWFDGTICRVLSANGRESNTDANVNKVDGRNNNHMYVIQITEADASITIGRPKLDANYQSTDNVVSPAFMIASQLGAVSSGAYTAATAAQHCGYYMEVEVRNGVHVRYNGWRLPTKAEVSYIANWQGQGWDTIDRVLTGNRYYTLDGTYQQVSGTGNATYVRCIRDLTPEEVEYLNNKSE